MCYGPDRTTGIDLSTHLITSNEGTIVTNLVTEEERDKDREREGQMREEKHQPSEIKNMNSHHATIEELYEEKKRRKKGLI